MGRKPLFGAAAVLWISLGLTGCRDGHCGGCQKEGPPPPSTAKNTLPNSWNQPTQNSAAGNPMNKVDSPSPYQPVGNKVPGSSPAPGVSPLSPSPYPPAGTTNPTPGTMSPTPGTM